MLVKYLSPFRTASAYRFRLVRPSSFHLRTTLATRPSSFLRDRCTFQLRTAHSKSKKDVPKSKENDAPKPEESEVNHKSEVKDSHKSEEKDGHKSEEKDSHKLKEKDNHKSEKKDGHKSEEKDGHKSESKDAPKSESKGALEKLIPIYLSSVVICAILGVGGAWLYNQTSCQHAAYKNENSVFHAIEQGSYPRSEDNLITREAIIHKLEKLFSRSYAYHLVVGEQGTGKTTAITQAANKVGAGIVYIQGFDNLETFSNAFADALGWKYEIAGKNGFFQDPNDKFDHAMAAFRRSAAKYKAKYNKPAVLILDDISKLAKNHPNVIEKLQDIAKVVADKKEFTIVFVTSEDTIPTLMKSDSWTCASPPLLIDDFTEDEALKYLQSILVMTGEKEEKEKKGEDVALKHLQSILEKEGKENENENEKEKEKEKEKEEKVKQLYQLFGGRIGLLRAYGLQSNDVSFEEIRKMAFRTVDGYFAEANIGPEGGFESIGKKVIQELVEMKKQGKTMSEENFKRIIKKDYIAKGLLESKVFSLNALEGTVTLQSKLIEEYVMKKILGNGANTQG
ncbi:P-loop containing nucleoside triphosphate hydrolase protein [Endogone sp. FLAS-F59071]|nr:P-loop containing nucleoside triphosphate hydrolase protein [Endogone sp. FLAS-F59071]|eukprot:RUS15768.1 P-loop containing nucleoside triphosphate hydrolase protein [Endogone sp. FLAS-F59071]